MKISTENKVLAVLAIMVFFTLLFCHYWLALAVMAGMIIGTTAIAGILVLVHYVKELKECYK